MHRKGGEVTILSRSIESSNFWNNEMVVVAVQIAFDIDVVDVDVPTATPSGLAVEITCSAFISRSGRFRSSFRANGLKKLLKSVSFASVALDYLSQLVDMLRNNATLPDRTLVLAYSKSDIQLRPVH